jgi:hypothetical protein
MEKTNNLQEQPSENERESLFLIYCSHLYNSKRLRHA